MATANVVRNQELLDMMRKSEKEALHNMQTNMQTHNEDAAKLFRKGALVHVMGLTSEAGQKLNGKTATVVSKDASGRWVVEFGDGVQKALKEDNLNVHRSSQSFTPLFKQPSTPLAGPRKEMVTTPPKTKPPNDLETSQTNVVPLTLDEIDWLEEVVAKHGLSSISGAVRRLIHQANAEPPEAKKTLFLVIRCRRCSAGAKGGVKSERDVSLPLEQWQWLENVKSRSKHASVAKTIRIVVDFYMSLCRDDPGFEQKVLRPGCAGKVTRHQDAMAAIGKADS